MPANRPARERFEFALDARQVASVILGSLASLAVTFYLGYAVGQRVVDRPARPAEPRPAPAPAPPTDPLAMLDQPPRPDASAPPRLSYHETLTSPKPPADQLPVPSAKPAPPPPTPAASAKPAAPVAAAPAPAATPTPSPTPTPTPTPTPAPTPATPPKPAPAAASAAKPPAAAPAPKATPKPTPTPASKGAPTARPGAFTVQVGATQDRAEADRIAARFAGRGAKVFVADVPGKGRWYRVRVGSFDTREAADRYLKDMERASGAKGFVTSAP